MFGRKTETGKRAVYGTRSDSPEAACESSSRIRENEFSFGGEGFRREGAEALVVDLTMRMKDGSTRTETLRFRRKAL
jgi:hypothetical protein